jgi:hypothetical protein
LKWLDVFGPPGVGKSTLCYPIWKDKEVTWDGLMPPASWGDFCDETSRQMELVWEHPTYAAVVRMYNRSFRKMACVSRMPVDPRRHAFIQTALIQRGLGFGWRLTQMGRDVNQIRPWFEKMPISIGAVHLTASDDIIEQRNKEREKNPATAHENRGWQAKLMKPAIEVALEVLRGRGIPIIEIDTVRPLDEGRRQLLEFADCGPCDAAKIGFSDQVSVLQKRPIWWI